jgi:hypothetical protein
LITGYLRLISCNAISPPFGNERLSAILRLWIDPNAGKRHRLPTDFSRATRH